MAILLILVATVAVLMRVTSKNPAGRARAMRVAVIAGGLAIIVLILGSTTVVSTRNIGVVTTFGRPEGTLSNGLHWKAPWQSVSEMSARLCT